MRHWTLYEAILHASYVAVRLQTWHDKGRRLTQEMLVKMGFPAPQFKQKFSKLAFLGTCDQPNLAGNSM